MTIGKRTWAIAEGYIPASPRHTSHELVSHEAACILNASDSDVHVRITTYYKDREPAGPYLVTVGARRTVHVRFNDLQDPEPIPRETEFSSVLEADGPIVVQHTRLDSRNADVALMTTTAYGE